MRKIGVLDSARAAQRFHLYLKAQGIDNRIEDSASQWDVWVVEEDRLSAGRELLKEFQLNPNDSRFTVAAPPEKPKPKPVHRQFRPRRRWGGGRPLVTYALLGISLVVAVLTNFGELKNVVFWSLQFTKYPGITWPREILAGQTWRLVTPIFIHYGVIHLGFNSMFLWMIGNELERGRGSAFLIGLVLPIAVISNVAQYLATGSGFGGLSGVVYGLIGFLWMRSRLLPRDGFTIPPQMLSWVLLWMVLGFVGAIGSTANLAHLGGLLAGAALGAAPRLWRSQYQS